jgi:hypothetical protein
MNDDIERRLEQWGRDRPTGADGAFANRLDADLRRLASERQHAGRQRPIWQPAVLALMAALLVFGGVFAFTRDRADETLLVMGATTETEVVLPSGEMVTGEAGLALPDGTRIVVGDEGSAVIADVVLEPGTEAMVQNGRLEILEDEQPAPTRPTSPTTTAPADRPTTTLPSTTRPTTRPTASSAERSTSTTTDGSGTTSTTAADVTTQPTFTDRTTTPAPDPQVSLDWSEQRGRIELTWTYTGPETPAGWEVSVTNGDRSRTLALLRDSGARSLTVERLDGPATYRVVARQADGAVIAESNSITVG